jgi:thiol:disulfide interchange protein
MKRIVITLGISAASIAFAAFALSQLSVDISLSSWHTDAPGYRAALAEQDRSGKPIALFFHTEWCSSCKKLRRTVLASDRIDDYFSDFIPVQINPEKSPAERAIADYYGVIGYPTFLIVSGEPRQAVPVRRTANVSIAEFIQACEKARGT